METSAVCDTLWWKEYVWDKEGFGWANYNSCIVDRSVELLSASKDSLTMDTIFGLAETARIRPWEESQINDYEYCRKKYGDDDEKEPIVPLPMLMPGPIPVEVPAEPALMDDPLPPMEGEFPITEGTSKLDKEDLPVVVDEEVPARRKRSILFRPGRYSDLVDALKMFDEAGLHAISDLTLETRPCKRHHAFRPSIVADSFGMVTIAGAALPAPSPQGAGEPVAEVAVATASTGAETETNVDSRTYFPETWL
ncbi:hypothetical protein FHG87_009994 [Trinorchestia longiramus]|nr:hypothetical protein FHG87_009994 [Trinorchestia longiramus]